MSSPFWRYFHDRLNWLPIYNAGPLSAIAKGLALHLDDARSDILWLREQWHPAKCEDQSVPGFGKSRRITRHAKENQKQFRNRVVNAWAWHMLGGKTLGLPEILKFYGFDAIRIENLRGWQPSRWAEFQLGLMTPKTQAGQIELLDNLEMLIWLVNEYKPARSVLARIYTDVWNLTPAVWSGEKDQSGWSMGLWSNFSGIGYQTENGKVIVSFCMPCRFHCESPDFTGFGIGVENLTGVLAPYLDRPVWSRSIYGDKFPKNHGFTIGELLSVRVRHDALIWKIRTRRLAKVQAVYGWFDKPSGSYGDVNAAWSRPQAIIYNGARWGDPYGHDPQRQHLDILERWQKVHAPEFDQLIQENPRLNSAGIYPFAVNQERKSGWRGAYANRKWQEYAVLAGIKFLPRDNPYPVIAEPARKLNWQGTYGNSHWQNYFMQIQIKSEGI